ncbi:sporulation domain-containing protein [Actinomadura soli]|uniref:Sporulation domain-containing protein n=1 Tax=Actinomadura soli TaxID=2508997 RepID=A0A5C4JCX8_9ACTN|nr:phosphodiester glycosidase family protein [Actinomadura soli]TMR01089.1 sporulation domain-containing protein [Actinomadura soli]
MRPTPVPALAAVVTALAVTMPVAATAQTVPAAPESGFGGGLPLSARPVTTTVAPGVTLTSMSLGAKDADDYWTVHVYLPATIDGPLNTAATALGPEEIARRVAGAVRDKGFEPRVERVSTPAFADRPAGTLGWTVRVGRYATGAEASAALSAIRTAGFAGGTRYTAQDGADRRAPQKVHMIRVDFREFRGTVGTEFGPALNGTEKLTDLAAATGAVAGINAQWFYNSAPGGLYVKDGKLIGGATQGRAGIKITKGGRAVDVDAYTAHVTLRAGRATVELDGVNRVPGEIWNCGGIGGDQPTEKAQHDLKCTDDSELVLFTPEWGVPPTGAGAEVVLDARDRVTAVNTARGAAVPAGGSTIQATGQSAAWLLDHVKAGDRLRVSERVEDGRGRRVALTPDTTILQVGPTLVRDGRVSVNAMADGVIREGDDQTFTYNWTVRANPRSMIGMDRRGRLMLVVVDGRQDGYSEGLGIAQAAELMKLLGAREAMNLDGGGSSVLVTRDGGIVNRPSDAAGQRSLGNVVLVRP